MTYVTDPIGDFLTRMRNAQSARRGACAAPWSRMKEELATVLKAEGLLEDVQVTGEKPMQQLEVTFVADKTLVLERISKPGRRVYVKADELRPVLRGHGISVLTTSAGLMTDKQARAKRMGGELLCTVS